MKTPAFQFYPQDFISSLDVQVMNVEQIGGYILLLSNAWIHDPQGYLPDDDLLLQRICRMNDKQWAKNKSLILKKFKKDGEFIFNSRLIQELEKQGEYRKKQALNGSKGGRPKANDNPEKAVGFSGETQTKAKKSSSISSSSSSSSSISSLSSNKEPSLDASASGEFKNVLEVNKKKDSTPALKKPKAEPTALHPLAVKLFCDFYKEKFNTKYEFNGGADGKKIQELLTKIGNKTEEAGLEKTDHNILDGWGIFLKSISDDWVLKNFTPAIINLKFNELFKTAKHGNITSTAGKQTNNPERAAALAEMFRRGQCNDGAGVA